MTLTLCGICEKDCSSASVLLWDGREYCDQCLEDRCAGLAQAACVLDALCDEIEPDEIGIRRLLLSFSLGCFVIVIVIFGAPLAFCIAGGQASVLHVTLFLVSLYGLTMAMMAVALWLGASRVRADLPMSAQVRNGLVSLETRSFTYTCALSNCRWSVGSTTNASIACFVPKCDAVLLRTPRARVAFRVHSEAERRLWEAFLTIAGVRRESWLGRIGIKA